LAFFFDRVPFQDKRNEPPVRRQLNWLVSSTGYPSRTNAMPHRHHSCSVATIARA
jgi:hypothetical protein